jgi:hypothetical protein
MAILPSHTNFVPPFITIQIPQEKTSSPEIPKSNSRIVLVAALPVSVMAAFGGFDVGAQRMECGTICLLGGVAALGGLMPLYGVLMRSIKEIVEGGSRLQGGEDTKRAIRQLVLGATGVACSNILIVISTIAVANVFFCQR